MKNIVFLGLLGVAVVLLYMVFDGQFSAGPNGPRQVRPKDAIDRIVESGRDVGRNAAGAIKSIKLPGK